MNTESLKKYLRPTIAFICAGVLILAFAVTMVIVLKERAQWIGVICAVVFSAVFLWIGAKEWLDYRRFSAALATRSDLESLTADFASAASWFKDGIRTGRDHLYVKRSGRLYEYSDIRNLHQYVHKTNGIEDRRELHAVTADGKTVTLCRLKTHGKSNEDMIKLIAAIMANNPAITVGYKK